MRFVSGSRIGAQPQGPGVRGCANCYLRAVKISIVVPAFNEEKLLGETLAQIKAAAGVFTNLGLGN